MPNKDKKTTCQPVVHVEFNGEVLVVENLKDLSNPTSMRLQQNIFIVCNQGHIEIEIGSHTVRLKTGQICVLPSSKTVGVVEASDDLSTTILTISDRVLRSVLGPQASIWNNAMYLHQEHIIDGEWSYGMRHHIMPLFEGSNNMLLRKEVILSFLRTFILLICEQLCKTMDPDQLKLSLMRAPRDNVIFNQFLSLLSESKVKKQPVSHYAEQLCITPKYLCTICSHSSGKTPSDWITEYVMEDIYVSLKYTTKSIKEIANELGFSNNSFFGKFFREHAGMTPSKYRQKMLRLGEE